MLQIALQRLPLFLLIALLAACSTTRVGSGTKSSNSSKVITQLEYNQWAGDIVISITPRLQAALTAPGRVRTGPVVLAMGDFKDKTAQAGANFTVTKDTLYGQVRKQLVNTGLVAISMDGRGRFWDNIFVERLWRSVKYEEVYLHAYDDLNAARAGIRAYFNFYNHERPHQALGNQVPADFYDLGIPRAA